MENKWQTPEQINYVSTKLLGRVRRAGAGDESRAHAAIWPVRGRTSAGGLLCNTPQILTDIYVPLSIDMQHMPLKGGGISLMKWVEFFFFMTVVLKISALF